MPDKEFLLKSAVAVSTKKNSYDAGKEIGEKLINSLNEKPDFLLLFSTGHYKQMGGFQELLNGLWTILPEKTIVVGGVVAGFLNNEGVYAKGVAALAVFHKNMNITIGYGKNLMRNPKKVANKCTKMIKEKATTNFKNKIILSFSSFGEMPKMPGLKSDKKNESKVLAKLFLPMFSFVRKTIQKGLGVEQEFLEEITKNLHEYYMIHGSTINSYNYFTNYQFLNKQVYRNLGLCLAIETDLEFKLGFSHGAQVISSEFEITKLHKNKRIIKEINNKPAFDEYLKILSLAGEKFDESKWIHSTSKYPIGFHKNNIFFLRATGTVLGDYMGFLGKIENTKAYVAKMDHNKMVDCLNDIFIPENTPILGFFVSCISRQGFMGIKVFEEQTKIKEYFKQQPFLLLYTGGEAIYKPGEELNYFNESITSLIFYKN